MTKTIRNLAIKTPNDWDRRGLPSWTYHSEALFELERNEVFLRSWQIVGHVSDVPSTGDWITFDLLGERAVIIRGRDNVVRAFHNLCRHRGARVADGASGHCKGALVCPFHGWVYNLDGTLRGPARPETFGDMDRSAMGLKPIELEVFHGFIFLRFHPGPQGPVAEWLKIYDADFAAYEVSDMLPVATPGWTTSLPVNWKSVRDVDNEGYHVALAHPALQDLYGRSYRDYVMADGLTWSHGEYGDQPGRLWSVQRYVNIAPAQDWLPDHLRKAWTYYGVFPNAVIAFTPESAQFYQEIPISLSETITTGRIYRHSHESREMRAARYLAYRIDRETSGEDQQLSIWSNESMKSSAFDGFHLSDLEYGVRSHHDQLRSILPVMLHETDPGEDHIARINQEMLRGVPEAD
jgi:phenylpropionate dioxygenase-like ring-hydroxylating dioxygenase large terminal subunit